MDHRLPIRMTPLTAPGRLALALLALAAAGACRGNATDKLAENGITPVYNEQSGRLDQLLSDRNHDGKNETRAFMDGVVIKSVEIDRNGDSTPDRWEYYNAAPNVIDHAEEANGPDARISRREFYADGVIRRVVDDTDFDGRPDKWEQYEGGALSEVELDLVGKGYASQRLVYAASGDVVRIETDPDGDGVFVPAGPREPGKGM